MRVRGFDVAVAMVLQGQLSPNTRKFKWTIRYTDSDGPNKSSDMLLNG